MFRHQIMLIIAVAISSSYCYPMIYDPEASKSNNSVSFLYYPSDTIPILGHAELEVDGYCFCFSPLGRPLSCMREKAKKDGQPFFRFVFNNADAAKCEEIRRVIQEQQKKVGSCSSKSLYPLWATGVCAVPLPIRISPLVSALYLTLGKLVKANNVKKIEYYGNPSVLKSVVKMVPGALSEGIMIASTVYISGWISGFLS